MAKTAMGKHIALKPVRFDKGYAVGDAIPGGVVDPKMEKLLVGSGRIAILSHDEKIPGIEQPGANLAGTHESQPRAPKKGGVGRPGGNA